MIELVAVVKSFGSRRVIDGFDLCVAPGSRVAVLGSSGCGKTTLLRLIAGLEVPDAGTIRIGGIDTSGPAGMLAPSGRGIGLVFQDGALFPHMTVLDNVRYGMHGPRAEIRGRALEVLGAVGLRDAAERRPAALSGGEQRRVALARALAPAPARLLLDEPFTNLDPHARDRALELTSELVAVSGASLLLVTHDLAEAEALGCEPVWMEAGTHAG